jgi:hypothetical protein
VVGKTASQIACLDLMEMFLALACDGSIVCMTTSLFDVVYVISRDRFAILPFRIWPNKFGCDFILQCKTDHSGDEQLEYWRFKYILFWFVYLFIYYLFFLVHQAIMLLVSRGNLEGQCCLLMEIYWGYLLKVWAMEASRP